MTKEEIQDKLFLGDNLEIMRQMPDGCFDLVYLDPPFLLKRLLPILAINGNHLNIIWNILILD